MGRCVLRLPAYFSMELKTCDVSLRFGHYKGKLQSGFDSIRFWLVCGRSCSCPTSIPQFIDTYVGSCWIGLCGDRLLVSKFVFCTGKRWKAPIFTGRDSSKIISFWKWVISFMSFYCVLSMHRGCYADEDGRWLR